MTCVAVVRRYVGVEGTTEAINGKGKEIYEDKGSEGNGQ